MRDKNKSKMGERFHNVQKFIEKNRRNVITIIICFVIAVVILKIPQFSKDSTPINFSEYSAISNICELATLRNYYHNVAMYEKEPGKGEQFVNKFVLWPFGDLAKVGYKQFWIEYSGIVEVGIDASQIKITGPDENNVVAVYVPDAKVLSVNADEESLSQPLTEEGLLTKVTANEKTETFETAQQAMQAEAEKDQSVLNRAKGNAKMLIEQYIINTGKGMGVDLSVKWIEKSNGNE